MSSDRTPEDVIAKEIASWSSVEPDRMSRRILVALRDAGYTLVKDATEERDYPRGARLVGPWVRITEGDNDA